MIKNTILLFLLSLLSNYTLGQVEKHEYLDIHEGIKKIEQYEYSSSKPGTKKLIHTKYYAPDGKLQKVEYSYFTLKIYYESEKVIKVYNNDEDGLQSAFEYDITRDSNKIIVKKKIHKGKYAPKNHIVEYEEYPSSRITTPFEGVELQIKEDLGFEDIYIFEYKNPDSAKEYHTYSYSKSEDTNLYSLQSIETVSSEGGDGYLHRKFINIDRIEKGKQSFRLVYHQIKDEYGFTLKTFDLWVDDITLLKPSWELSGKYKYQLDEKKNWVGLQFYTKDEKKLISERIIEYY